MNTLLIAELEGTIEIIRRAQTFELVTDAGKIVFKGDGNKALRESLLALFEANLREAKK